ncbi:MAG: hypothetical protein D6796_09425 [Caldilineae bacterium]|nr:MAG: hypothetical protein D6796_09425 [Caldilineae bacterium]
MDNPPAAPALSKRAELILKLAMALLGPLLMLALLEGVAFVWERGQANGPFAWELVASRRIELVEYPQPGAGYTLMKPNRHYEWGGIPVDINAHGLRGPETGFDKPDGVYRILNLGDSVAMGWGVRVEETYGQQLAQQLNAEATGTRYEVINAGVPGWNLENELAYLQAEGLKYQPDLIVLDVTVVNDIYGKSALVAHKRPPLIEWLRAHTYFWPFLSVQLRWAQARAQGRERIDVIDPPYEADKYFPLQETAPRWNAIWGEIEAMNRLAQENGAQFVLLLFPLEYQVLDETYPTTPQKVLSARAAEAGIPALDLLPAFREACLHKPGVPCTLEDHYLFADVWMHPSPLGHRLAMEALHKTFIP